MTLIPVSRTSGLVARLSKLGAERWIGQRGRFGQSLGASLHNLGRGGVLAIRREDVYRATKKVEDAAEGGGADGDGDRFARVDGFVTPGESIGGVHCHCTHYVVAQVLCHLNDQVIRFP